MRTYSYTYHIPVFFFNMPTHSGNLVDYSVRVVECSSVCVCGMYK